MGFYLTIILFSIIVLLFSKRAPFLGWSFCLFLLGLLMFRGAEVGTDTKSYLSHFYNGYGSGTFSVKNFEFLYIESVNWLSKIFNNPEVIIEFLALITFLFLLLAFKKFGINFGYGFVFLLFSGIYFYAFNGSRQIASVAILLYSYSFLIEKSKNYRIKYLLCVIFASSIHISSLFFIPLVLLPEKRIRLKTAIIIFVISSLFFLLDIGIITNYISSFFSGYYMTYSDVLEVSNSTSLSGKIFYFISTLLQFIVFLNIRGKYNNSLTNLFYLSIIMFLLLRNMHPLISRVLFGITIIQIIVYSFLVSKQKPKEILLVSFILIMQLYSLVDMLELNVGEIIPYKFYFPY